MRVAKIVLRCGPPVASVDETDPAEAGRRCTNIGSYSLKSTFMVMVRLVW